MRRRDFITLLGGAAATWPLAARAQQPAGRVYRVGYLAITSRERALHLMKAFEEGLRSLGYRVGENVVIEYRFADGEMERLPALATDLVRLGVDVIVSGNNVNTVAAMKATTTIPIVMASSADPVSAGLVASLARPGGNVTGIAQDTGGEQHAKRVELLKDTLPNLSRVGILWNPDFAPNQERLTSIREAAPALGLTLVPVEARGLDALEQAFATMVRERAQMLVVLSDGVLFNCRGQIGVMALGNRLPAIAAAREYAEAGLLLTYGIDFRDQFRQSAVFVDKIFKGAKPADLPVEQPTKFELVVNLKTAKALGIDCAADAARPRRRGDRMKRRDFIALLGSATVATGHWPRARNNRQDGSTGLDTSRSDPRANAPPYQSVRGGPAEPRLPRWRECRHRVPLRRRRVGTAARACCRPGPARRGRHRYRDQSNTVAAMKATTTIPIVMTNSVDPVGAGLVASLARPGGNVTGLAADTGDEIIGKRLELLKETLPNLSRVGILWNPDFEPNRSRLASIREAAQTLGLTLVPVEARGLDALEPAFTTMVRERARLRRAGRCCAVQLSRPDWRHGHQKSAAGNLCRRESTRRRACF